jgi:tetratricopeptide (TPR) repeat protein
LPRETSYEQLGLGGLDAAAIKELVDTVADHEMPAAWVEALTLETSGNPFFLREVLLHLEEEGALAPVDGSAPPKPESLRLPDTVRQVIARRLARLPTATTDLLRVAAAFTGGIDFEVTRQVAGLEERAALDALDAALGAQLLVATSGSTAVYDFTHALVRHTFYEALNPARQVRLHRAIAEAMEVVYGGGAGDHAAEIARHYHRSASLPGAERGVPYCLAAAEQAERAAALSEAAEHLRAAVALLPKHDARRPRLVARLGLILCWSLNFETALELAGSAAREIAQYESENAAADYLAEVVTAMDEQGYHHGAFTLAEQGLRYVGARRDSTWVALKSLDIMRRETSDPDFPGLPVDSPERRELAVHAKTIPIHFALPADFFRFSSRDEIVERRATWSTFLDFSPDAAQRYREKALELEGDGRMGRAILAWALCFRACTTRGDFTQALEVRAHLKTLTARGTHASVFLGHVTAAEDEWRMARDEDWDVPMGEWGPNEEGPIAIWYRASNRAGFARIHARTGRVDRAIRRLESVMPAIEKGAAWSENYVRIACDAAETLWLTERTDHIKIIERNLLAKVVEPDFRYPMMDGRLALGRLCALQQRYNEAVEWFARARTVLDEQGARPLRAIVDYDEALMYARRGAPGDAERARPLLDAALQQFRTLGMPGWMRRAEALLKSSAADGARAKEHSQ